MKLQILNKNQFERVILTDTLPYESPYHFSNEGFYRTVVSGDGLPSLIERVLSLQDYSIAYSYCVARDLEQVRLLSVMHPASQLSVVDFYKNYHSLIVDRCSISPFSIRAPKKVADHFYEDDRVLTGDDIKEDSVEDHVDDFRLQSRYASSFFAYRGYVKKHKFVESVEFLELEKRFARLYTMDVAKCFYNIYTHSIAWAVKGKAFAKRNLGRVSFESEFDKLMQKANYSETNGILVGPEVSRIFAEIILQSIDRDIISLLERDNIWCGKDYEIRRFVDDYFIFSSTESVERRVTEEVARALSSYKLYPNESKAMGHKLPYSDAISCARGDIVALVDRLWNACFVKLEIKGQPKEGLYMVRDIRRPERVASNLIGELKALSRRNGADFGSVCLFVLAVIKRKMFWLERNRFGRLSKGEEIIAVESMLRVFAEFILYMVAREPRMRVIDTASQILVVLKETYGSMGCSATERFERSVVGELERMLGASGSVGEKAAVDVSCFLVVVGNIAKNSLVKAESLARFAEKVLAFPKDDDEASFPYFESISLLLYVGGRAGFSGIEDTIFISYRDWLRATHAPQYRAEAVMLFLDMLSYPFFDKEKKVELIRIMWVKVFGCEGKEDKVGQVRKFSETRTWFANWSSALNVRKALMKKELRVGY